MYQNDYVQQTLHIITKMISITKSLANKKMIITGSIGIHISTLESKLSKLSYYSYTLIIK